MSAKFLRDQVAHERPPQAGLIELAVAAVGIIANQIWGQGWPV